MTDCLVCNIVHHNFRIYSNGEEYGIVVTNIAVCLVGRFHIDGVNLCCVRGVGQYGSRNIACAAHCQTYNIAVCTSPSVGDVAASQVAAEVNCCDCTAVADCLVCNCVHSHFRIYGNGEGNWRTRRGDTVIEIGWRYREGRHLNLIGFVVQCCRIDVAAAGSRQSRNICCIGTNPIVNE